MKTPRQTLDGLERSIADAPAQARTGARFLNLDTRVIEWLVADARTLASAIDWLDAERAKAEIRGNAYGEGEEFGLRKAQLYLERNFPAGATGVSLEGSPNESETPRP